MIVSSVLGHRRLTIGGKVQGVGFRPFVYRLATELGLTGGVQNTSQGVVIEIEGAEQRLEIFLYRLQHELPPHATIQTLEQQTLVAQSDLGSFHIWSSAAIEDSHGVEILPDLATCSDCLQDILAPDNRRYQYPFTNCTHCGPRFSIIHGLPYDRQRTTMAAFKQCPECRSEYVNPGNRRFHAQPNACDRCGPRLEFWVAGDCQGGDPLESAIAHLQNGKIIALKGLGGFQLLADAKNFTTVARLRQRKDRPDKPLALMYPTLESVRYDCKVSPKAAEVLSSAQAPVVLLPKLPGSSSLANNIAPNTDHLGVMLPTTPLHHLLLQRFASPIVATSGNLSGEPICIDEQEALKRLAPIADGFLIHNRPIQRPVDDSVVQLVQDHPQLIRHARGYAPQVVQLSSSVDSETCILALGAHLKNTLALSIGDRVILSQHIGDLESPQARERLHQTAKDFLALYHCQPTAIACDRHPDYGSTQLAHRLAHQWNVPLIPVQHHYAHVLAAMAEHQLSGDILGIAWDGTGYGLDQTIWGGEFLQITADGFKRVAHWLPFPLPGGDICSREPRRSALGLLYGCYGATVFDKMTDLAPIKTFTVTQLAGLQQMLTHQINTPMTSSMGRLFDGIASILDLHQCISFEGQGAMSLEGVARQTQVRCGYPFIISRASPHVIDWRPLVRAIIHDQRQGISSAIISAKFHRTLVEVILGISQLVGCSQVVLTGGCFQNKILSNQAIEYLKAAGIQPYWHQRIPPNDGGIAVGQVLAVVRHLCDLENHHVSSSTR